MTSAGRSSCATPRLRRNASCGCSHDLAP
jgi:hypothetical protein